MIIQAAVQATAQRLAGLSDAPHLDAERLVGALLAREETAWIYSHGDEELSGRQAAALEKMIRRRETGEPLAYILGYQEFWGRKFAVNRNVLIPRPATEDLVEAALRVVRLIHAKTVAEIGTGSGCVAVTLALEAGDVLEKIIATDISRAALRQARANAEDWGVDKKIDFREGDRLEPLRGEKLDLIVSNPPYIPSLELDDALMSNTPEERGLKFEPRLALDGGVDGQDFIREISATKIPAVLETMGGEIIKVNLGRPA